MRSKMRDLEDQPPSYEEVVSGGEPPKYSSVAEVTEKEIRVSTNPTPPRVPPHVPSGRLPRGKWYGRHNLVPISPPVGTLCQREASQAAVNRLWIRQEGSQQGVFPSVPPVVPNKEFSNCCLIILMVAVVLSLLVLLQPWGGPYSSYQSISNGSEKEEEKIGLPESPAKPSHTERSCRNKDCFSSPPTVKDGTLRPGYPNKMGYCYQFKKMVLNKGVVREGRSNVFDITKNMEFFEEGSQFKLVCQSDKVLSDSPAYLDPDYTGTLANEAEFVCKEGGWMYIGTVKKWLPISKNGEEWIDASPPNNKTEPSEFPVECVTRTQLIKQQIG